MSGASGATGNGSGASGATGNGSGASGATGNGSGASGATGNGSGDERFERGLEIRKEVTGATHVERSMAQVSDFSRPVQEYVTRCCWGEVWDRPGLDRRTRSLLNLVMLTALGRSTELGVHVRGAVTNGASETEIQEALLQATVYCGAPAGLEAFRVADRVLGEIRDGT